MASSWSHDCPTPGALPQSYTAACQPRERGRWGLALLRSIPAKPSLTWAPRGLEGISRCQPLLLALCHIPGQVAACQMLVGAEGRRLQAASASSLWKPAPGVSSSSLCPVAQSPTEFRRSPREKGPAAPLHSCCGVLHV